MIPLPLDARDPGAAIDAIEADPAREESIRRRNASQVLLRHDWSARWADVLRSVGLRPLPALEERRAGMRGLAAEVLPAAAGAARR